MRSFVFLMFGITLVLSSCIDDDQSGEDPIIVSGAEICGIDTIFKDMRDGQTYSIVQIGNQCWFAENLNYATSNSWCYAKDSSNCEIYGRLYNWETANTVCPSGWHLPTEDEWLELIDFLGENAGGKMKHTTGWNAPNADATNSSGFSGLPGGYRYDDGYFDGIGNYGYWWSSTENVGVNAIRFYLDHDNGFIYSYSYDKGVGLSCRCVKD
ncbi:MAG: fibrobacter succinogenes major paralogous domain-containing protein [Cryomorphaceae bacterium]|nr:fibrobacter succinogenes major paralogous domain-containing protein [Cryomorphaceae bacterium]